MEFNMEVWELDHTEKYETTYKRYAKKHPHELTAVLSNLDKYHSALNSIGKVLQITAGFIHREPNGVIALDQKGGGRKVKLKQTRLYLYPAVEEKVVYLLIIGDKKTQTKDIKYCSEFVRKKRRGNHG